MKVHGLDEQFKVVFPLLECCRTRAFLKISNLVVADIVDVSLARPRGRTTFAPIGRPVPILAQLVPHLLVELDRLGFERAVRVEDGHLSNVIEPGDGDIQARCELALGLADGIGDLVGE